MHAVYAAPKDKIEDAAEALLQAAGVDDQAGANFVALAGMAGAR